MASPFRRYASRIAWEWGDTDSKWRSVDGTLLFVDISGFTALSERLAARGRIGAEELTQVLGRVFGTMLEAVHARGGTLLKFGGDALLLLFDTDDHAMQAAASAVEMRAALRAASKERTSVGRISLRMSQGMHSGPVDLFLLGDSHKELIIAGPTASKTTVMESTADASEIMVSPETAELLPRDFIGNEKGAGFLLRKRKIDHPTPTFSGSRDSSSDVKEELVSVGLREIMRADVSDSEHRVATVGFLGFGGLDDMLARSPEEAASALETLVSAVQAAVDPERVTFLSSDVAEDGGKIILTSGVPVARRDDEGRILRAARHILDSDQKLDVRIGLNRGHVFAGAIGEKRATYTVMGDTVNLAARLMTAAPYGSLYSHPSVPDKSSTLFKTTALEKFEVKGKAAAVEAYEVGDETGSRPPEATTELVFTGRDKELVRLSEVLATPGASITITGDSGIGKTRLISEAVALDPDIAIFTAQSEPARSESPYWAVRDSMRDLLGVEAATQPEMRTRLEKAVEAIAPDLAAYLPLIGDVTQVDVEDTPETSDLDTRFRPAKTAEMVTELLERMIPDRLAIIAEDAHWMDELSIGLITMLSSEAATRPWSVVVTARAGETGFDTDGDILELGPLSDDASRAIAIAATEATPLRPRELEAIVSRAGGNPLFLGEILQVVRETGDASELPDSLEAVVSAEIDTLAPLTRQLLRYAAVLGRSFATIIFERLLDPEGIHLDQATWSDLNRFLERQSSDRLRFKLAVVHSAAYHGLSYRRRKELHARAGGVIEQLAGVNADSAADVLAYHFSNSGDHDKAWRYSRVAAARAKKAYANEQAVAHLRIAVDASNHLQYLSPRETADPMIQLGDTLRVQGDSEAARDWFARALGVPGLPAHTAAEVYLRRAGTWYDVGRWSTAKRNITWGQKTVAGVRGKEAKSARARLDSFAASIAFAAGRYRDALALAQRAIGLTEAAGEVTSLARAYDVADKANFMLGNDAPRFGAKAIALLQERGHLLESVKILNNMGAFAYFDSDWNVAAKWYRRGIDAAERSGHVGESGAANTRANLAELLVSQRRFEEAIPLIEESKRVITAANALHALPFVQLQEARALTGLGNPAAAVDILESVYAAQLESGDTYEAPETAIHLAEALIEIGRPKDAIQRLDRLESEAADDAARVATGIKRARALAMAAQGALERAEGLLRDALRQAAEEGELYEEALILDAIEAVGGQPRSELESADRKSHLFTTLGIVTD